MIELNIPGRGTIQLEHLVCDVNGTLAVDGILIDGVSKTIADLQDRLTFHMLTANTHGRQKYIDETLGVKATRISGESEAEQKLDYVRNLGSNRVIAIGQGANDAAMLKAAAVGIGILSTEGIAAETLIAADIIVSSIGDAFDLLLKPVRLVATLRK